MKLAVVGSGIAGLASAYFLAQRHDVTLFEQDDRVGGHTNTVRVPTRRGWQPIDTGWIVYNTLNYPNLTALLDELEVETRATAMSFAVSIGDGAYEWKGSDELWTVFAQPSNLLRPSHWRLLTQILRLNRVCRERLRAGVLPEGSLADFLEAEGFAPELRSRYLLPMAAMIWSCSPQQAGRYPAADFMRFFDAHGLFTAMGQPTWRTVVDGSDAYVRRMLGRFGGRLQTGTPVRRLQRGPDGVRVATGHGEERYDRVVCATHSDQALALLADPDPLEARVLSGIPYTESRCVLHTDESFLPRRRAAWASWNYLHPRDEVHDQRTCGSYWMNLLQGIVSSTQYIVTLNPPREVPERHMLYETNYQHPLYTAAAVDAHALLPQIQNRQGVVWAGAWCGYGFHEDGLTSALRAVQALDPACVPSWATGLAPQARPAVPPLAGGEIPVPAVQ